MSQTLIPQNAVSRTTISVSRAERRERMLDQCASFCMDDLEKALDDCQGAYEQCKSKKCSSTLGAALDTSCQDACGSELRKCRRQGRTLYSGCEDGCIVDYDDQCYDDCEFYKQNRLDDCEFAYEEAANKCLVGDAACDRQTKISQRMCEAESRDCYDQCRSICGNSINTCQDNCLSDMEDTFDLCQFDYDDCESLSKGNTNAISTCKLELRQCKSNGRSAFNNCDMDCSYAAEQGCCEACEKAKQDCLWVKSEDLDICRYQCMPKAGEAARADEDECIRTCDRKWRGGNADCRDASDTCVAQNCQRTYGTCREDCLDYTEDCFNSCEADIEACVDGCRGGPDCEAECKRRYRQAKETCRDSFNKCDGMCDADSRDLCMTECEKVKQKGLMDCDRAVDDCNALVVKGQKSTTDCSRDRRVCEANIRDGNDWCTSQCAGNFDTDLATCQKNLQVQFDSCQSTFESCETSAAGRVSALSDCQVQRRTCHDGSITAFQACEKGAEQKWTQVCYDTCEKNKQSCLDASDAWYEWCMNTKCGGVDACQRFCKQRKRTNEMTCFEETTICQNDCAFVDRGTAQTGGVSAAPVLPSAQPDK
eukprot:GAFH01001137.1.p1 GENE.GAFH01001137.1~~GAFH01001137.1.p1  ORF type:complete len:594 (-),score=100.18 GAFH01001137.1:108-1889(-)